MKLIVIVVAGLLVAACSDPPGAETTTVAQATTTTAAGTTSTTSTTTTEAPGLEGGELLACMVGSWRFDTEGFRAAVQAHADPGRTEIIVDHVSGGGSLVVGADSSFTLEYDDLTYRLTFPTGGATLESLVVVSGEVSGGFTLEGNVFLAGEVDDPALVIRSIFDGQEIGELPPTPGFDGSLRMGTRANHPYYLEEITIDCSPPRLVVNHLRPLDALTEDDPSVIWSRQAELP